MRKIRLWLDDIRDPKKFGYGSSWLWVKTADEAIKAFQENEVMFASLDHDLTDEQMVRGGYIGEVYVDGFKSGYDVVNWLEENPQHWPADGVQVHSMNPAGKKRMEQAIQQHYGRIWRVIFL